jgi:hypothetical protein
MHPFPSRRLTLLALAASAAVLAACGGGGTDVAELDAAAAEAEDRLEAQSITLPPLRAAPAGVSGNLNCANWRVGAITVDNVEVPAGAACRLTGTIVRGSVQVQPGGILVASAVQVTGSVQGDEAAHVQVTGTTSRIGGNVELEGGSGATLTGIQVGGDVFANGLTGVVSFTNNRVAGGMQVFDGLGGGTITGNRITGNLQCEGNLPAPIAGNNTAALIQGQCAPVASGGGTPPPPPLTGNVTCVGLTIGAIRLDSVIVPANASCTLLGTILNGSIEVGANAQLTGQNLTVTGDLKSDGAAVLSITGTTRIGGAVQIQRGAGATIENAQIRGDLQFDAMLGPVTARGNAVTGNLQAMANRGGVSLVGNRMGGVMQCKDNLPAPTGSGNVASSKQDQCLRL